jgi:hypothetical protein
LLEKLELWLTDNMPGVSINRDAALGIVEMSQRELEEVRTTI